MPAKKKTKAPAKKASAKKTAATKAPAKKAAKKAAGKTASKKVAAKKSVEKSAAKGKSRKDTPTIFKISPKKNAPTGFTLEDVQAALKTKKKTTKAKDEAAPKKAAAKKTAAEPEIKVEKRSLGAASINDILGIGAGSTGNTQEDEAARVPKKFKKFYKALVELRDHFTNELELHTSETLKRSSRDDSGDLSSYSQHQADAGTDTFDRDLALSMVSNEQDALYEIEQAIQRIFDGTYGVCEITGQPISKERLMAVPFTRFSVEGQAEYERMNRRKVERGGVFSDADDSVAIASDDDE